MIMATSECYIGLRRRPCFEPSCFVWVRSTRAQQTINKPVRLKGRAGFSGAEATIVLLPAPPNTGRVFHVGDARIPATVQYLQEDPHAPRTTLVRKGRVEVKTIEHLMAALFARKIDNVAILSPT